MLEKLTAREKIGIEIDELPRKEASARGEVMLEPQIACIEARAWPRHGQSGRNA